MFSLLLLAANADVFCPGNSRDFGGGGNIWWHDNGYTMKGSGGLHGKTAFNLLGGFVQFDMDTSGAQGGVNNNFYTTSPWKGLFPNYCDIQANGSPQCMEMDIVENNGNCISQVTWHTWPNHNGDCDEGGCWGKQYASGKRTMRAEFSSDGWMTTKINGGVVQINNPRPSDNAKQYVAKTTREVGLQFQSSQWVGWVPGGNCPGGNNLDGSSFSVTNIIVSGTIVQGQTPTRCADLPEEDYLKIVDALEREKQFETLEFLQSARLNSTRVLA